MLQGENIAETGIRDAVKSIREVPMESKGLCCYALADAIKSYIESKVPQYRRLADIQTLASATRWGIGSVKPDEATPQEARAYAKLWDADDPVLDFDPSSFESDVIGLINADQNQPQINGLAKPQTIGSPSREITIENTLIPVINLAVDNRINSETLMNVINWIQAKLHDTVEAKNQQLQASLDN